MKCDNGFTLVEVLIAALILFTSLAIIADIFKSSTLLAEKAAETARMYQVHPTAVSAIKTQLRDAVRESKAVSINGSVLIFGITYEWRAERYIFNAPPPDSLTGAQYPNLYGVYEVIVESKYKGKVQDFTFKAASW